MDPNLQFVGDLSCSIRLCLSHMSTSLLHMVVAICQQIGIFFSVIQSQLETIGRIPIGFLCILLRKYSSDVLWFCGGLQKFINLKGIRVFVQDFKFCVNDFLEFVCDVFL